MQKSPSRGESALSFFFFFWRRGKKSIVGEFGAAEIYFIAREASESCSLVRELCFVFSFLPFQRRNAGAVVPSLLASDFRESFGLAKTGMADYCCFCGAGSGRRGFEVSDECLIIIVVDRMAISSTFALLHLLEEHFSAAPEWPRVRGRGRIIRKY